MLLMSFTSLGELTYCAIMPDGELMSIPDGTTSADAARNTSYLFGFVRLPKETSSGSKIRRKDMSLTMVPTMFQKLPEKR